MRVLVNLKWPKLLFGNVISSNAEKAGYQKQNIAFLCNGAGFACDLNDDHKCDTTVLNVQRAHEWERQNSSHHSGVALSVCYTRMHVAVVLW